MKRRGRVAPCLKTTLARVSLALAAMGGSATLGQVFEPVGEPIRIAQTPQTLLPPGTTASSPYGSMAPGYPGAAGGFAPYGTMAAPPAASVPPPSAAAGGPATADFSSLFGPEQFGAGATGTVNIADNAGYIDSAIIRSRFRLRYDTAYGNNRPDRAEYFYAKCGCFNTLMVLQNDPRNFDPKARGPKHPVPLILRPGGRAILTPSEINVDYQSVSPYIEFAPLQNFSAFIELPTRYLNPTLNANANGFSDLNLGFKYAFVANPDQFYTFQFRTYVPTGDADRGLGTGHPAVEPGILIFQRLTERLYFSGEFLDWIPIRGSNFAGNILNYGMGLAYNVVLTDHFRVAPVNEFVGWTILSGKKSDPGDPFTGVGGGAVSAVGDTIVNYKIGLRFGLGDYRRAGGGSGLNDRHSLYVGYGTNLTGDHWYQDMFRLEYNLWF